MIKNFNLNYISVDVAKRINEVLSNHGVITENRVMILCPPKEGVTNSGIIIPKTGEEELPRKGILVQKGHFDSDNINYDENLIIGTKLTFGMYAGKEINFEDNLLDEDLKSLIPDGSKFTILSCNEIIYIENNYKV